MPTTHVSVIVASKVSLSPRVSPVSLLGHYSWTCQFVTTSIPHAFMCLESLVVLTVQHGKAIAGVFVPYVLTQAILPLVLVCLPSMRLPTGLNPHNHGTQCTPCASYPICVPPYLRGLTGERMHEVFAKKKP